MWTIEFLISNYSSPGTEGKGRYQANQNFKYDLLNLSKKSMAWGKKERG